MEYKICSKLSSFSERPIGNF